MQANTNIERVSTKKLDDVISSQKHFSDKSGLGYTGWSSSSGSVTKEVKFIKAKKQIKVSSTTEKPKMEEKRNVDDQRMMNNSRKQSVGRSESRAKSCPRSQRGPRSNYVCHPKRKWRVGEKGYSCISITTCPYINTSYALWLCLVVWLLIVWVKICLFVFAYIHSHFFNVTFDQSFPSYVSKIQKPHKK